MAKEKKNGVGHFLLVGGLILTVFFSLSVAVVAATKAPDPVILNDDPGAIHFGDKVQFLEDRQKEFTINEIADADHEWTPSSKSAINLGFTESAYWFRFKVRNTTDSTREWFLIIPYPLLNDIELYVPQNGKLHKKIKAGTRYPFSNREIIDKDFVFRLSQSPGDSTYFVRIVTDTSLNFEPIMKSQRSYLATINKVYPIFWLYYGAMLIMVIYNLILFILIREKSYLYLVLFICTYILFQFTLNGFSFQYLWPNSLWWANNCLPTFMCLSMLFITMFLRSFLNIPEVYADSMADKATKYVVMIPALVWAVVSLPVSYAISIKVAILLIIVHTLTLAAAGVMTIGYTRNVRFVVISCVFLFLGVLLYCFKTFGLLPANFFTIWGIQIGSVLFVALLSVGLADRITMLKNEMLSTNSNISLMLESISQETADVAAELKDYREEEIGQMLKMRFETFMDKFKSLIREVNSNTEQLKAASGGLLDLSGKMAGESGDMSENANMVASASEQMSAKMNTISSTMEQTSQNVTLIASSIEEMTTTVDEITSNTEVARSTTANAVSHAGDVSRKLDSLNEAAENIGSVTEVIAEISKKTNLLALNATIEAARAGEAGRGFAVVANEIKELAQQTATATQQINQQIQDNKQVTMAAVEEIGRIVDVISNVDEIVSTIASSIEEQSTSTKEIASNVNQISQGVSEVNKSVAECSTVAENVTRDVTMVSTSTDHIKESSNLLRKSADDLLHMAEELAGLLKRFKV
ncbi:MAG: 7TM diverse intracellular signaling domain-containing protein [Desulfosudaceae bacterium]